MAHVVKVAKCRLSYSCCRCSCCAQVVRGDVSEGGVGAGFIRGVGSLCPLVGWSSWRALPVLPMSQPVFPNVALRLPLTREVTSCFWVPILSVDGTIDAKRWKTLNNSRQLVVQTAWLCRATTELAYGILLDQKFLCRSVHAAFVNTKWYETWSGRTLFVDPIINDVQRLCVLIRMQGQRCDCRYTRHSATGQDASPPVVRFRWSSFITS